MQSGTVAGYPLPFKRQVPVTEDRTLSTLDLNGIIRVDSSLATVTITLPPANTIRAGGFFQILALTGSTNPVIVAFGPGDTYNDGVVAPIVLDADGETVPVIGTEAPTEWLVFLTGAVPIGGDIRTARIIVGNALEGDTAADVDFLDSGNGGGVAAALTAAAASGIPTDVYFKSGVYDFNLPGAPILPLPTTVAGTTVRGAGGQAAASIAPGTPGSTTFVLTPTSRALFVGGSASLLGDFAVRVPAAAAGAVGTIVIDVPSRGKAENITVSFEGAAGINADESLTEVFSGGFFGALSNCRVDNALSYGTPGGTLAGFRFDISFCDVTDCLCLGLDVGFSADPGSSQTLFEGCRAFNGSFAGAIGFVLGGIDSKVVGCSMQNTAGGTTSVSLGGTRNALLGCVINGGNSGSDGVVVSGSGCSVSDCDVSLCVDGIRLDAAADLTLLSDNQFGGNTLDIDDTNGATNTQRVVAAVISDTILTAVSSPTLRTALLGELLRYDATAGTFSLFARISTAVARGDAFGIKEMGGSATAITVDGNGNSIQNPVTGALAATTPVAATFAATRWVFDGSDWLVV